MSIVCRLAIALPPRDAERRRMPDDAHEKPLAAEGIPAVSCPFPGRIVVAPWRLYQVAGRARAARDAKVNCQRRTCRSPKVSVATVHRSSTSFSSGIWIRHLFSRVRCVREIAG